MKLDITHRLGAPTLDNPSGGIEVKIDGEVVTTIRHIDLHLDAESIPTAEIEWPCFDGVTFSGEVKAHHYCPISAWSPDEPAPSDVRKALKADIQLPLSYEADTHEMEALRTLEAAARAYLTRIDESQTTDGSEGT